MVATVPAQQPAEERDDWLAERGVALRFPTKGPLSRTLSSPHPPWETPVLGLSAFVNGRRIVLVDTPRSSAGPDPRTALPAEQIERVTVPVVDLSEPGVLVDNLAAGVRAARLLLDGWELLGPAAADLALLCAAEAEGGG
jgi:nitrogen fixation protein